MKAKKVWKQATKYTRLAGKLYKMGKSPPYAIMHRGYEIALVFVEVHSGAYSSHIDGRSLAYKLLKIEYYWPTLMKDNITFIEKYD